MSQRAVRAGVLYGIAAYTAWGLFPIYFKAVAHVGPCEVLAHRIIWSAVFLAVLMRLRGGWKAARQAIRNRKVLLTLVATTVLIAINWLTFIWAIGRGYVLQASLGYFINPLVNVLLGYAFLGERLRPGQKASVLLAGAGVLYLTVGYGQIPWIALVLAGSFAFYGLLRKTVRVEALVGLTVETILLAPLALAYLAHLASEARLVLGHVSLGTDLLLLAAGVLTAVPLLWFTNAARRLRLATLGFLQYLAPTGQFLLAVFVYHEPFTRAHVVTFACIWLALALYSADTALRARGEPLHDL